MPKLNKLDKAAGHIADGYVQNMVSDFGEKFGAELQVQFDIISGGLNTTRRDGKPLTKEQRDWLAGYAAAYATVGKMVREAAGANRAE